MDFNRRDLLNTFGKQVGLSKYIALRRANLGYSKMVIQKAYSKRLGNYDVMQSIIFFEPDECISFFEKKIENKIKESFSTVNPMYIKCWEDTIKVVKYFKEKENE
jgi:hypothetical protein